MTQITPLAPPQAALDRSAMLRQETRTAHKGVDDAIMESGALDSPQNYMCFVRFQHQLMLDLEPLYRRADLQQIIPDLPQRSRLAAVESDAAYLEIDLPESYANSLDLSGISIPEALGWLYVSEGSNLGAAFLAKAVLAHEMTGDAGAAHLAAPPVGRAAHWRGFTTALNAVKQSTDEERSTIDGARNAFAHVRVLIGTHLPG
ncbi:biliverdin-producing heme oxygenase [Paracoccus xiamenensis]|uniref:biliverdin-producing heme oxygenase n=1 Tax=Paracoccus xiamenensis TaxID=2714901 RepID=UPI00140C49AB|nr:biliverdin-producing heme oxygenase [Paracoccus xiamenensis]NHF74458.1 biliverdin-producing heme oxygenase [Paracoccus xiamenensis]